MMRHQNTNSPCAADRSAIADDLSPRVRAAITELLRAYDYAQAAGQDLWSFAVEIETLRSLGLSETDFRWLECMGLVEHAREVTRMEEYPRQFQQLGKLSFSKRTCFVLTERGVTAARVAGSGVTTTNSHLPRPGSNGHPIATEHTNSGESSVNGETASTKSPGTSKLTGLVPTWDSERHELRVNGMLVKQFKWPALNQEMLLATFQEEGWPSRIDDPLPPQPEQDSKRRLSDTIKCLNRKQSHEILHFRGDGTGEGVVWEFIEPGRSHPSEPS